MLREGDRAPDFTLLDHAGEEVTLRDLRPHRVLIWFYPKADTPG